MTLLDVEHKDSILRTFILFVQTAQAVLKYTDALLYKEAGLSVVKLIALQALDSNDGAMTPSGIAEWTHTERHNITMLVTRMRRDGLVITERNNANKRFVNIVLTDKGREVHNRAMLVARKVVNQVMSSIIEGDAVLLEKSLGVLRRNARYGLEELANRPQP